MTDQLKSSENAQILGVRHFLQVVAFGV